ncbi:hypothetical protein LX32DRAFT_243546 [Colletotrichum zoysiae]|uniref:Uncharacterized protein n=1 Tax=Colletotrichum zoysiae TaxID=1216348 RepID=A0AAD9M4P1_9PEZI|nr:hypothetical protein LX32DRAFT_243546 [Colletotrichum zoysiae]
MHGREPSPSSGEGFTSQGTGVYRTIRMACLLYYSMLAFLSAFSTSFVLFIFPPGWFALQRDTMSYKAH